MESVIRKPVKRRLRFKIRASTIFIVVMLAYPVGHFLLMWFGVNVNTILLSFQTVVRGRLSYLPADDLFANFETLFLSFRSESTKKMFFASGIYFVISCLITLPISMFFSYFVFKKIRANGFFKIIFFLPSILPLIVLALVYKLSFNSQGLLAPMLNAININPADLFIGGRAQYMVWIFCIWAGIGYNVILLTSGMARIPREILESCKMDGIPPMKEFMRIVIPLTWPTVTTLFIFGMLSVFNVFLQPLFLTSGTYNTKTIGLEIYWASRGSGLNTPATLGLFCSIIGTPIVLATRAIMNKMYGDVTF